MNAVTIGTARPRVLAEFYARLFGVEPSALGDDWAQVRTPGGMTVNLEREHEFRRPVWPARAGEPVATQHLDVQVDDLDAAAGHAVACGAVLADVQPQDDVRVLLDPDGHPFCLYL
ncbi:VOC family protein [Lentzea sp.]|uniref:VOC family protein n=1 Tax=Lentzea sp. TaxID=56099 RepID=UPI002ED4688E